LRRAREVVSDLAMDMVTEAYCLPSMSGNV
jgi:hypothetical protein